MVFSIHIGFRHCGKKTISVIVDYNIKAWQLNPTTVIYVLDVELLDGVKIKNNWCIRFLFPISEACSTSFHDFFGKIHSESPYYWPCIKLHWRFWADGVSKQDRLTWFSWKTAHSARYVKRFHDPQEHYRHRTWWFLFGEAIFNDEFDLAMFPYKKEDKTILSHENLDHDIKLPVPKRVF